jgi:hypothetical protein
MKAVLLAVLAGSALLLSGCWCSTPKCYPYPLYDYSPPRVCNNVCQPGPAACPVAPGAARF